MKKLKGFTLIELLLVIAIISILLVVVFAALNPATRLQESRDARRWNDVNQVLTAVHECLVDNDGSFTTCGLVSPQALTQLGTGTGCTTGGNTECTGAATACDNADEAALGNYIARIPSDPQASTAGRTGYSVTVANGIVTITACLGEGADPILVSR